MPISDACGKVVWPERNAGARRKSQAMNNNKTVTSHEANDDWSYAMQEYGVTRDELDRFVLRMNERIARERRAGRMKLFTGDIENDIAD